MDLVIRGVNNLKKNFILSNYSLTSQIVIINLFTTCVALFFLIFINIFLLTDNINIDNQKNIAEKKLIQIADYLSQNTIKKIPTYDDSCNSVSIAINRELARLECNKDNLLELNKEEIFEQLDPTYTQQYVYSNFLDTKTNVKVFDKTGYKFADTKEVYSNKDDVVISEIELKTEKKTQENKGFYSFYEKKYFDSFDYLKKFFDIRKILKNNIISNEAEKDIIKKINIVDEIIFMVKQQPLNNFNIIFVKPITKNNIIYGFLLTNNKINFKDTESASQSILLTNFFIFFISIMFILSFLFSKSIVSPIKILSKNANLERDKMQKNKDKINYPNRKDEIGTLSNDIKSMSDNLKKRIKEIEEFSSDVSHELKNPLTSLKSSSELLKNKKLNKSNTQILFENIENDIDRMNILISDISNYSLTQVEISEEVFERIELIEFLNNFKNSISDKIYNLKFHSIEKKIFLTINKNKFLQVLYNLLDNASNFISINSNILIYVVVDGNYCKIHLADQGTGIPIEHKDKIFERFYTDRNKDKNSHSGLGLSISRKIIDSFNGTINLIKSEHIEYQGACFEIKLPLKGS